MRRLLPFLLIACSWAQVYNARTDVNAQAYPSPFPSWGGLTGQGTIVTPTDFNIPIIRATDNSTSSLHGAGASWIVDCGGSAETSFLSVSDTRAYFCELGQAIHIFQPPTFAEMYGTYIVPDCSGVSNSYANNLWFSRTLAAVAYSNSLNASGNVTICSYNFASATTGPTIANSGITTVVDISTYISALGGLSGTYIDDVSVTNDNNEFGLLGSTTAGQGSNGACYAVTYGASHVWYWNTCTGRWFICSVGSCADQGTVSIAGGGSDTFTLHNVRIGTSSTTGNGHGWLKVGSTTCLSTCTPSEANYFWEIGTATVKVGLNDSSGGCGHTAIGANNWVNNCDVTQHQNFFKRLNTASGSSGTTLPSAYPTSTNLATWDQHMTWANPGNNDLGVFYSFTVPSYTGGYTALPPSTNAWDGEALGVATDGTGNVYRFAHAYDSFQSPNFEAANGIGGAADGVWACWASDGNGSFGNTNGSSTSCSVTSNCRSDVLCAQLPIITTSLSSASF